MSQKQENDLKTGLKDASFFVAVATALCNSAIDDHDGKYLQEARSELSNASNAIDDAMGLIDQLLAPEPPRQDLE